MALISFSDVLAAGAHEEVHARHPLDLAQAGGAPGRRADRVADGGRQVGRHRELHAARAVLGLVVVPLGLDQDLADGRGLQLAIAEHAALHLATGHQLLREQLLVVREAELERRVQRVGVRHARDAHAGAEPGRLDEHGIAELRDPVGHRLARLVGPQGDRAAPRARPRRAAPPWPRPCPWSATRPARRRRRTPRRPSPAGPAPSRPRRTGRAAPGSRRRRRARGRRRAAGRPARRPATTSVPGDRW